MLAFGFDVPSDMLLSFSGTSFGTIIPVIKLLYAVSICSSYPMFSIGARNAVLRSVSFFNGALDEKDSDHGYGKWLGSLHHLLMASNCVSQIEIGILQKMMLTLEWPRTEVGAVLIVRGERPSCRHPLL